MPELLDAPFVPVASALACLDEAVSPLVGIVGSVVRTTHAPDDATLPHWACLLASAKRTLGSVTVQYGGGAHPSAARARAAALGEAIERYSAAYVPHERLVATSARALGRLAVDPGSFALFHPRQFVSPDFPFVPFGRRTRLRFVEGISLADGSSVHLPAQLVFLGDVRDDQRIGYPTSSGLACGATFAEAALAGLLELVERDAVMLQWNGRLSLPGLDWRDDPALMELEQRYFLPSGLRYSVLSGSLFLDLPVAIAVVHGGARSHTALAMGGGSAPTIGDAWLKALSEAFGVHRWLAARTAREPDVSSPEPDSIRSFDDHMLFYADHGNARLAAFLDESQERRPTVGEPALTGSTARELISDVLDRLARRGVTAFAVDVTAPDVATLGVSVVRVVAPQLCQLDVVHAARFLGGERLYEAPFAAGLTPEPLRFDDLNPHPHPFP